MYRVVPITKKGIEALLRTTHLATFTSVDSKVDAIGNVSTYFTQHLSLCWLDCLGLLCKHTMENISEHGHII